MKKFLAVCLSAALAASMLVGCGGNNEKVTAKVIDIDLTNEEYAFGVDKEQPELLDEVNDFIASIKETVHWMRSAISISQMESRRQ